MKYPRWSGWAAVLLLALFQTAASQVVINETDADQTSTDMAEFVELFGTPNLSLDGYVLVFYNGNGDVSYRSIDLDGQSLGPTGFWVAGNPGVPSVSIEFPSNGLQNGADAVALYQADASDFPNGSPVSTTDLVDAIVYDTSDSDDPGLLILTPGQPQINEDGGIDKDVESNSRVPDGGTPLVTTTYVQQAPTPGAPNGGETAVVINEVDADTPSSDVLEFVELFGTPGGSLDGMVLVAYNGGTDESYQAFDLDGFSIAADGFFVIGNAGVANVDLVIPNGALQNGPDAVALYLGDATDFPNGTPVTATDILDALVYGTNDPDDAELLAVLTPGQPQVDESGGSGSSIDSNSRLPDGGIALDISTYRPQIPTPGETNVPSSVALEIFEIQGDGPVSPYENSTVETTDNVVTAVGVNGFYIQTPTARDDGDPLTSNGLFVFTSTPPAGVAVGDLVDVTGPLVEFNSLTEITAPTSIVVTGTEALPAAIPLDATFPSMTVPDELERVENMLVSIASGVTTGPTDRFGDAAMTSAMVRTYREPGIEQPGISGLPVWDGNPELFKIDVDNLGLPAQPLAVGAMITNAVGAMSYNFGQYEFNPTSMTVTNNDLTTVPVRPPTANEFMIGSYNVENLDMAEATFANRLVKISAYIREVMMAPDALGLQEVENLATLEALADQLNTDDASLGYTAYLLEAPIGQQTGRKDVGFLIRNTITVNSVTQLGADEIHLFDQSILHDRAPLLLEGLSPTGVPFSLLNIHSRSLSGIDGADERVRNKRWEQSNSLAQMIQDRQSDNLFVVGDFNAFQFSDGYVDVLSIMSGNASLGAQYPDQKTQSPTPSPPASIVEQVPVSPALTSHVLTLPAEERYSFNFRGNSQALDQFLSVSGLNGLTVSGMQFARGNADNPESLSEDATARVASDHDGFVGYIAPDASSMVSVSAKIWMQGPFNGSGLDADLTEELPLAQPYSGAPWNYAGTESVSAGFFQANPDIVDWVLVELRKSPAGPAEAVGAALVKSDGSIVGLDGSSDVMLGAGPDAYYLVVRQRNHLAVISPMAIILN